jgi:hypothetical protein
VRISSTLTLISNESSMIWDVSAVCGWTVLRHIGIGRYWGKGLDGTRTEWERIKWHCSGLCDSCGDEVFQENGDNASWIANLRKRERGSR